MKSRKRPKRLRALLLLLTAAVIIGGSAGGFYALVRGIPSVDELKQYKAVPGTKVYADDDTLIGEFKIEKGIFVPLSRMPESLVSAVVAVEDSRFWKHKWYRLHCNRPGPCKRHPESATGTPVLSDATVQIDAPVLRSYQVNGETRYDCVLVVHAEAPFTSLFGGDIYLPLFGGEGEDVSF